VSPPQGSWAGCSSSQSVGIGNNSKEANGITLVVYMQGKLGPHVGVVVMSSLRDDIFNFCPDFVACGEKMLIGLLLISMYLSRLKKCPFLEGDFFDWTFLSLLTLQLTVWGQEIQLFIEQKAVRGKTLRMRFSVDV